MEPQEIRQSPLCIIVIYSVVVFIWFYCAIDGESVFGVSEDEGVGNGIVGDTKTGIDRGVIKRNI